MVTGDKENNFLPSLCSYSYHVYRLFLPDYQEAKGSENDPEEIWLDLCKRKLMYNLVL